MTGYQHAAQELQMINGQYRVAIFADWLEDMEQLERKCFPGSYIRKLPGQFNRWNYPRGFTYPLDEANTNPANYSAAVAGLSGGDEMISRVWWDKP